MSLDLCCASLTLRNDSYNAFRLTTCGSVLVGHKGRPNGIGRGVGRNIGCMYCFV